MGLLLDECLRLLAHVLRKIIERRDRLARVARALPAAERLIARPGAGRRALGTVRIRYAGFDLLEKPLDFRLRAVHTRRETEIGIVRERNAFAQVADPPQHDDRQ